MFHDGKTKTEIINSLSVRMYVHIIGSKSTEYVFIQRISVFGIRNHIFENVIHVDCSVDLTEEMDFSDDNLPLTYMPCQK